MISRLSNTGTKSWRNRDMEDIYELIPLFVGAFGAAFIFGILINPIFWQGLRNSYWLDKQKKQERMQRLQRKLTNEDIEP